MICLSVVALMASTTLSRPLAEITKTRLIIDKILNNNENRPPVIEKVLFYQNPIQRPKFKVGQQSSFTPDS
jgi:hypothetical protein